MTESWSARLSRAMDDDEAGEVTDAASGDPGPGPWDADPQAVADQVMAAAVLGYPTDADADAILATPGALERLTRRWAAVPPSLALIQRAATNPALRRLLALAGSGRPNNETDPNAAVPVAPSAGTRPPERLRSMQGSAFALAAADRAGVRHDEAWSGGRVIRQRLPDGSTAVTAEYTGSDPVGDTGDGSYVVSLSRPGETRTPLLLLILVRVPDAGDPIAASTPWAAQAVVGTAAALGELEISGPIPVSALGEAELRGRARQCRLVPGPVEHRMAAGRPGGRPGLAVVRGRPPGHPAGLMSRR